MAAWLLLEETERPAIIRAVGPKSKGSPMGPEYGP